MGTALSSKWLFILVRHIVIMIFRGVNDTGGDMWIYLGQSFGICCRIRSTVLFLDPVSSIWKYFVEIVDIWFVGIRPSESSSVGTISTLLTFTTWMIPYLIANRDSSFRVL